jgi:hydroxymethylglutaryl-CoA lyase
MKMKKKIQIIEVGPRDGLQNEKIFVPTEAKLQFIKDLARAGLRRIEVTSFVRPDRIPQLADATELYRSLREDQKVDEALAQTTLSALVPNLRGMQTALEAGVQEVAIFTAASDAFTERNTGCSIEESFRRFADVIRLAQENRIPVRGYVSTIIECPYSGPVNPHRVIEVCKRLLDAGCYEISLGETIGVAVPDDLSRLLDLLIPQVPVEKLAGHYHDTRGTALSLVFRSLEYGMQKFDSSAGGLGGCPYASGAAGNLATEDLLYALDRSGYDTGVDLHAVIEASGNLAEKIQKMPVSRVYLSMEKRL